MELSPQQEEAVSHIGSPALVIAGAGSGKTRTLTAKIARLVLQGYEPEKILAITFTNKAAEEMKSRLVQVTGMTLERFPWVRTYHSACFRILKKECGRIGYQIPLQIYAGYQQQKAIREILLQLNIDKKYAGAVQSTISHAKNSGDPEGYLDNLPPSFRFQVGDVFQRYNTVLKDRNAIDFDDILLLTRNLLREHEDVRTRYQNSFRYVLVDEYQDTNNLQDELTGLLLANGNLFCVGDDWQAIYSFRGSNIDHFLTFIEKYPEGKTFRLEQNFRSADEIVQVANCLIRNNEYRMEKECYSEKSGGQVDILGFDDDREEAGWVGAKIEALYRKGVALNRMAVLYRTRFSSLAFEHAFRTAGIPYRMMGGKGFFERKEIMDILFYLTAAVFDKDDVAFERIVNVPRRGIGPGTLKKLSALRFGDMSLQDAVQKALHEKIWTPKLYAAMGALMTLLEDVRCMRPGDAIQEIMDRVNYQEHLLSYSKGNQMDYTARMENIEQLVHVASQKDTISDYLEESSLVRDDTSKNDEPARGGVNLSTIHAAKGLEFEAVFVVGCEENLFPHWRSMESDRELEEERRLMYVSVTRSEKYLYLSHADYRKGQYNMRSRFIDEIESFL